MTLGIPSRARNTACLVAGLVLLAGCNYESGERALERGDEARAAAIWEPLARRGDTRGPGPGTPRYRRRCHAGGARRGRARARAGAPLRLGLAKGLGLL